MIKINKENQLLIRWYPGVDINLNLSRFCIRQIIETLWSNEWAGL